MTKYRIVSECNCGGDAADTVCYECLCNYYNQKQHDIMQRKFAISFFESMMNGQKKWSGAQIAEGSDSGTTGSPGKHALYNGDGLDQSSRSYSEIWDYIADDTDEEDELDLFDALKKSSGLSGCEKPYYEGSLKVEGENSPVMADLIWPKRQVAFFLKENCEQYSRAKETNWKVFCMDEPFDVDELVVAIKG